MAKSRNYQEINSLIPQEEFGVIGDCRDLRLFHVELREIYITPREIILRELFRVIAYAKLSQSPDMTFPKKSKQHFGKNPLCSQCPTPQKKHNFCFYCRLAVSEYISLSVALTAEPRGEKKLFFCANFGR